MSLIASKPTAVASLPVVPTGYYLLFIDSVDGVLKLIDSLGVTSPIFQTSGVQSKANLAAFPVSGVTQGLYHAQDTGFVYRWTGSAYARLELPDIYNVIPFNAAITVPFSSLNHYQAIDLTGATTLATPSSVPLNSEYHLLLRNGSGSAQTVTFSSGWVDGNGGALSAVTVPAGGSSLLILAAISATSVAASVSGSGSGSRTNLTNFAVNSSIGTAATTVDSSGILTFTQTTAGISVTLPSPTTTTIHRTLILENLTASTANITVSGAAGGSDTTTIVPGQTHLMFWQGSAWVLANGYTTPKRTRSITNLSANAPLMTAAEIDTYDAYILTQTTAGITATLATPGSAVLSRNIIVYGATASTASINIAGLTLVPGGQVAFSWTGGTWVETAMGVQNERRFSQADIATTATLTAATTVDLVNFIAFAQATASSTVTIPNPTITTKNRSVTLTNAGTASLGVLFASGVGFNLVAGTARVIVWDGSGWRAQDANLAPLAEYGEATLGAAYTSSSTANTPTDVLSFVLPGAGVWEVEYFVSARSAQIHTSSVWLSDSSNVIVPSSVARGEFPATAYNWTESNSVRITTTGAATYKLRAEANVASALTIQSVGFGSTAAVSSTHVTWKKIGGYAPVIGALSDVFSAGFVNTGFTTAGGQGVTATVQTNPQVPGTSFVNFTSVFTTIMNTGAFTATTTGVSCGKSGVYEIHFKADVHTTTNGSGSQLIIGGTVVDFGKYNENASTPDTDGQLTLFWTGLISAGQLIQVSPIREASVGTDTFNDARIIIKQVGSTATIARAPVTQVFTASGTYTPTPGISYAVIKAVGGGGQGGGSPASQPANTGQVGSGGNSGGYVEVLISAALLGASQTVTIGVGGSGATGIGNAGSATTLGALFSAPGGAGGPVSSTNSNFQSGLWTYSTPAAETAPTISVGLDLGSAPTTLGGIASAGGSATFSGAMTGTGGASKFGNGGRGAYTNVSVSGAATLVGTAATANSGGGGGGGWGYNGNSSASGGAGGSGKMIIIEHFL